MAYQDSNLANCDYRDCAGDLSPAAHAGGHAKPTPLLHQGSSRALVLFDYQPQAGNAGVTQAVNAGDSNSEPHVHPQGVQEEELQQEQPAHLSLRANQTVFILNPKP